MKQDEERESRPHLLIVQFASPVLDALETGIDGMWEERSLLGRSSGRLFSTLRKWHKQEGHPVHNCDIYVLHPDFNHPPLLPAQHELLATQPKFGSSVAKGRKGRLSEQLRELLLVNILENEGCPWQDIYVDLDQAPREHLAQVIEQVSKEVTGDRQIHIASGNVSQRIKSLQDWLESLGGALVQQGELVSSELPDGAVVDTASITPVEEEAIASPPFKDGDWVTWSSQAAGSRTEKVGVFRHTIPAMIDPYAICLELKHVSVGRIKFDKLSRNKRALVEVRRTHARNGEPIASLWYAPLFSAISHQTQDLASVADDNAQGEACVMATTTHPPEVPAAVTATPAPDAQTDVAIATPDVLPEEEAIATPDQVFPESTSLLQEGAAVVFYLYGNHRMAFIQSIKDNLVTVSYRVDKAEFTATIGFQDIIEVKKFGAVNFLGRVDDPSNPSFEGRNYIPPYRRGYKIGHNHFTDREVDQIASILCATWDGDGRVLSENVRLYGRQTGLLVEQKRKLVAAETVNPQLLPSEALWRCWTAGMGELTALLEPHYEYVRQRLSFVGYLDDNGVRKSLDVGSASYQGNNK